MLKTIQDRIVDNFYFARKINPTYDPGKTLVICNPIVICSQGSNQYMLMCITSDRVYHEQIINYLECVFLDMKDSVKVNRQFYGATIALIEGE